MKGVQVFATIDPYETVKVIDAAKVIDFPAGAQIIAQGAEGDYFYLLQAGEAHAEKQIEPDATKTRKYIPGGYFGELALMNDAPRAASVFADTDCTCLALDKYHFLRLLSPIEEVFKQNMIYYEQDT